MAKLTSTEIAKRERAKAFVMLFDGTVNGTMEAMKKEGFKVTRPVVLDLYHDPVIRQAIRERAERTPGVLHKQELQEFWTRVAEGAECEAEVVDDVQLVRVSDPDVDGGEIVKEVEVKRIAWVPPAMRDRLKASELLAKSQGLFIDRIELEGDLKIRVTDLLDHDLIGHVEVVEDAKAEDIEMLEDLIGLPEPEVAPAQEEKDDLWG